MTPSPYIVWRFHDAPQELQALSTKGGDEDWLVEVPPAEVEVYTPRWIAVLDSCREPSWYDHPTKPGWRVVIGAHA